MQSSHSAFRPSSIAAAVILPDAAESSLKTSSALRNAVAATSLSPSTTRERIRRVQPSTSRGELSRRSARPSTIARIAASCSCGGVASDLVVFATRRSSPPLPAASVCEDEAVSEAFALASSYETLELGGIRIKLYRFRIGGSCLFIAPGVEVGPTEHPPAFDVLLARSRAEPPAVRSSCSHQAAVCQLPPWTPALRFQWNACSP